MPEVNAIKRELEEFKKSQAEGKGWPADIVAKFGVKKAGAEGAAAAGPAKAPAKRKPPAKKAAPVGETE